MATHIVRPLHIRLVSPEGLEGGSLCASREQRYLKCFDYQVKHAVYSGADICDDCCHFYETHRDHYDNIPKPWDEEAEAMAFGWDA